jgi:hypothetical protein
MDGMKEEKTKRTKRTKPKYELIQDETIVLISNDMKGYPIQKNLLIKNCGLLSSAAFKDSLEDLTELEVPFVSSAVSNFKSFCVAAQPPRY